MALAQLRQDINDYVQDKNWYWYVPFWLFGAYLFVKLFEFELSGPAPSLFIAIANAFNFFLHEITHLLLGFLPHIFIAASGSLSEIALGTVLIVTAILTKSYFANLFCGLWFMLACFSTADYMADARSQKLSLVSFGGGDPIHDWNFVFTELGVLQHDIVIAGIVRVIGVIVAVACLLLSAWLIIKIMGAKSKTQDMVEVDEHKKKNAQNSLANHDTKPFIGGDLYPSANKGPLAEHTEDTQTPQEKHI